jgi:hypothetical protein
MNAPRVERAHGGVRGANLLRGSQLFQGPFGRIFRALPPADFGSSDSASLAALKLLAQAMLSGADDPKTDLIPRRAASRPRLPTWASSLIMI